MAVDAFGGGEEGCVGGDVDDFGGGGGEERVGDGGVDEWAFGDFLV